MPSAAPDVMTIDEYRVLVREMSMASEPRALFNSSTVHAGIVIARILEVSKSRVAIVAGELRQAVYDQPDVLRGLSNFLKREGSTIDVICEREPAADNAFLDTIKTTLGVKTRSRFGFYRLPAGFHAKSHFSVGDGRHLRLESDCDKTEATVVFNDEKSGERVVSLFEAMKRLSIQAAQRQA